MPFEEERKTLKSEMGSVVSPLVFQIILFVVLFFPFGRSVEGIITNAVAALSGCMAVTIFPIFTVRRRKKYEKKGWYVPTGKRKISVLILLYILYVLILLILALRPFGWSGKETLQSAELLVCVCIALNSGWLIAELKSRKR